MRRRRPTSTSTVSTPRTSSRSSPQWPPAACPTMTRCTAKVSATSKARTSPSPTSSALASSCWALPRASRPSSSAPTSRRRPSARASSRRPRAAPRRCPSLSRRTQRAGRSCSSACTPHSSPRTRASAPPTGCSTVSSRWATSSARSSRRAAARGVTRRPPLASPTSSTWRAATRCLPSECRHRSSTTWCAPRWTSAWGATTSASATRVRRRRLPSAPSPRRASRPRPSLRATRQPSQAPLSSRP
mmetsp:Transcript_29432/g.74640  ORF Transcript_29432/g.74640 Transcript_29432/m.74640 type:complete len:245 (+) Transcript_29432:598-1332(+)